jgi:hypothetical protein
VQNDLPNRRLVLPIAEVWEVQSPVVGEFCKYPEFFSLIPQSMRHLSLSSAGITKLLLCANRGGFLHIFVTREYRETVRI